MNFENVIITGKINNLERQILQIKADMEPIQAKLKIAYEYKDNLYDAMRQADDGIKKIQDEYFAQTCKIHGLLEKMQEELKIYTSQHFA